MIKRFLTRCLSALPFFRTVLDIGIILQEPISAQIRRRPAVVAVDTRLPHPPQVAYWGALLGTSRDQISFPGSPVSNSPGDFRTRETEFFKHELR